MVKLTKDMEHVIKWLAAEYKFLNQLSNDLGSSKQYYNLKQDEIRLLKDRKLIGYLGKSESVVEHDIKKILKNIEAARKEKTTLREVNGLLKEKEKEIEISSAELLLQGSKYVGELKTGLNRILTYIEVAEKPSESEGRNAIIQEIQELEKKLGLEVKDLMQWLAALDATLDSLLKELSDRSAPISPETRETKKAAELRKRAKGLKKLGLKGDIKNITKEKAEKFFLNRFYVRYSNIERTYRRTGNSVARDVLEVNQNKNHLLLFPLNGALFSYFIAKGMLQEMQRNGLAKNVVVLTIQLNTRVSGEENRAIEEEAKRKFLDEQLQSIFKKHKVSSVTVLDEVAGRRTVRYLTDAFKRYNIDLDYVNTSDLSFHSISDSLKLAILSTYDLMKKDLTGKARPISHQESYKRLQSARVGWAKELLTTFGRVYYYLGKRSLSPREYDSVLEKV
jgi:hypothetical protein